VKVTDRPQIQLARLRLRLASLSSRVRLRLASHSVVLPAPGR
jgi:hypothetical protein